MDLQNFFNLTKPYHICILILIFTALATKTLSLDQKFQACAPQTCGNGSNISYPFRIAHSHRPFCGHPNFEVSCINGNPVLDISDEEYIIEEIFYTNHSLHLVNAEIYEKTCPTPSHNLSLERTPFSYSSDNRDFFLFYNCKSKPEAEAEGFYYPLDCASNDTSYSFGAFHKDILEYTNFSVDSCQYLVSLRVDSESSDSVGFDRLLGMNYSEVLKMGFVLNWTAQNCSNCERSGGRCGFENNEFICFCPDGPHFKTCHDATRNVPRKVAIGLGSGFGGIVLMVIVFFIWLRYKKKKYVPSALLSRSFSSDPSSSVYELEKGVSHLGIHLFTYNELEEATNKFDPSKELGDGGFGTVYYGVLQDGRTVAVKRLYENNYKRVGQFMNEVEILTRLRHPNLVSLYGCTSRHSRELLLVYEYVPNGTIADHLHGERMKPGKLPWPTRMKIAIETADALVYLHASDIIHRDVKTNNILLDDNFSIKVADFGLSRLFPMDVTHVSTAPQGTPGYVDPEYHQCYQLTDKSDVYSFGVVLVELISSLPAVDITRHRHEINLSNMAINRIQNHALNELVDQSLGFDSDFKTRDMISAVAELAFRCLQNVKEDRPSMVEVLEILKSIQTENYNKDKAEEIDISADDLVLLKHSSTLELSPKSVSARWISTASTPNTSG